MLGGRRTKLAFSGFLLPGPQFESGSFLLSRARAPFGSPLLQPHLSSVSATTLSPSVFSLEVKQPFHELPLEFKKPFGVQRKHSKKPFLPLQDFDW